MSKILENINNLKYKQFNLNEEVEIHILSEQEIQLEKFKSGINCSNWNNKEIIIPDKLFVNLEDILSYGESITTENNLVCVKYVRYPLYEEAVGHGDYLIRRINEISEEISSFINEIKERVKGQKSKTKSCNSCGSIISTDKINHISCPVCGCKDFLLTNGDKNYLTSKLKRKAELITEYSEKREKYTQACLNKAKRYLRNLDKKLENLSEEDIGVSLESYWIVLYK